MFLRKLKSRIKRQEISGETRKMDSLFASEEGKIVGSLVPKIPKFIRANDLTLSTIIWSILVILSGFLSRKNISWLWLFSLSILLQYITDSLDGALGRYRKEGFIKWGYFMDHFLDYIFLCAVITGYSFIFPEKHRFLIAPTIAAAGALIVSFFLTITVTKKFIISYMGIGPTELRFSLIIINTLIIIFGRHLTDILVPVLFVFFTVATCAATYNTQKRLWQIDMEHKKKTMNKKP